MIWRYLRQIVRLIPQHVEWQSHLLYKVPSPEHAPLTAAPKGKESPLKRRTAAINGNRSAEIKTVAILLLAKNARVLTMSAGGKNKYALLLLFILHSFIFNLLFDFQTVYK